ncbi:MAG: cache domain-containing sensor histidine kinase [Bacillota bacterium]
MKRYISIRAKFITLFVLLITIPFLISGISTYNKFAEETEKNSRAYSMQIMNQVKINLENTIKDADRITVAPLYNEDVLRILEKHNYEEPGEEKLIPSAEITKMARIAASLTLDQPGIERMIFFTRDGIMYSVEEKLTQRYWNEKGNSWMQEVLDAEGRLVIIEPHETTYYKRSERVISAARALNHPATGQSIGVVKIDFNMKELEALLSEVWLSDNSQFYLTKDNGELLFPDELVNFPDTGPGDGTIDWNGQTYLYTTMHSKSTKVNIHGLIPMADLQRGGKEIVGFTILISVISLIIAYLLAIFTSERLVRPIRYLQSRMRRVKDGAFSERADLSLMNRDEIGQLAQGFNLMVTEVERLVKEVYETKLREREAELSALQSQINPHFMYNTLELVSMQALKERNLEISDIVASLGKMLRYTVDKQERPVQLKEEIRFVNAYLQIQLSRHGEKLSSEMYVDPSFESCLVPKLLLQPLVENALEHGMGNSGLTITIRASVLDQDLLLTVQDNGLGMPPQRLLEVREQMLCKPERDGSRPKFGDALKGYAIKNIHHRVQLLYGVEYGLSVESDEASGTLWRIRLPLEWGELECTM